MATEIWICVVAMRGSILDTAPRASMQYILYTRLGTNKPSLYLSYTTYRCRDNADRSRLVISWYNMVSEILHRLSHQQRQRNSSRYNKTTQKTCTIIKSISGLVVCNWSILVSVIITVWCTYDSAGRSWVKMKQYQRSMRQSESKFQYKRSGSTRNWRQRSATPKTFFEETTKTSTFQESTQSIPRQLAATLPIPLLLCETL